MLPNFLICGAQKSGTTSLQEKMGQHPNIYIPEGIIIGGTTVQREIHFFESKDEYNSETTGHWQNGIDWYRQQFNGHNGEMAVGEKTATYLKNAHITAPRIQGTIPDARLLFILRDPRKRAYSQYWMHRRNSGDTCSFRELLEADVGGMRSQGHYAEQLKIFLNYFDREQLQVFTLQQLEKQPLLVYRRSYRHVGVDDGYIPIHPYEQHYKGGAPRSHWLSRLRQQCVERGLPVVPQAINLLNVQGQLSQLVLGVDRRGYPDMDVGDLVWLTGYYEDFNRELGELFPGLDIEHWGVVDDG